MLRAGASSLAAAAPCVPWSFLVYGILALTLLRQAGRLLHRLWWRPRRLERALRAQGLRGTPHRLLASDLRENARMNREAWSRPLPLRCHDIAPRVAPFLCRNVREHGKQAWLLWFGPVPRVIVADPQVARDVLSNKFGHLEKPNFPALTKLLADDVAGLEGEKWVKHRRILNPAFHVEKLKFQSMLPAFSACCDEVVRVRWVESVMSSDGWCELDVWPELQNLTGDVIPRTAFGSSYLEGRQIFQLQAEQAERLVATVQKIIIPGYLYLPTKNNRRMREINNEVSSLLRGLIEKRMQAMKEGESHGKDDLLGLLRESNMRDTDEHGQSSLGMTIEDVIECKLFYFAGMETTSVLLTWAMVLLCMHPEWQDRAREEVFGLFGKNKPEYDGLSRLKTCRKLVLDQGFSGCTLRPPAISISRKTYKEIEIGGVRYPAGVVMDPDLWGSDVHEFRPDRFAEGVSKAPAAFFPFGWGPRTCIGIGQNFALLEAKKDLSMILQRFEFELAPSYTHAPHTVITLPPMHGAQIKLKAVA
ncbi:unnamed protein product [Miscanthus lutarioriparius]|uniref:Cytochrome P450 n=1 Tax=Miscanthus lutarioriparius TaxID=422564 RepID=A0A811MCB7_9POAL|nr:unnamed protein product [Miscanthus lutarioriparius]